jgi:hypothetical protein
VFAKHGEYIVAEPALISKLERKLNPRMPEARQLQKPRQQIAVRLKIGRKLKEQGTQVAGSRRRNRVEELKRNPAGTLAIQFSICEAVGSDRNV